MNNPKKSIINYAYFRDDYGYTPKRYIINYACFRDYGWAIKEAVKAAHWQRKTFGVGVRVFDRETRELKFSLPPPSQKNIKKEGF